MAFRYWLLLPIYLIHGIIQPITLRKIVKCILVIVAASILGILTGQGKQIYENDLLGATLVWLFVLTFSCLFFMFGSHQYRTAILKDRTLRKAYYFSVLSLVYSFLQIFVWSMLSQQFPPKGFGALSATVLTIGMGISLFGPAAPWIIMFRRQLIAQRKGEAREKIPEKRGADT